MLAVEIISYERHYEISPQAIEYLHSGDVLSREGIGCVADKETCFTYSSEKYKDKSIGELL